MIHDPQDDASHAAPADNPADAPAADDATALHRRRIRSFVTRAGRVSTGQRRALDDLGPRGTTAEIAGTRPADDFLGVEVHEPGVGALLKLIGEQNLTNIRIIQHDAVEVLEHMIAPDSLDGVHIYFPDPWHKARHHKRRLIQPKFVALLVSRLKPGGYIHLATDWQNYAEQMLEVLSAQPALQNTADGYAPRPDYRPVTKFERRGIRLGHGVWDLLFRRR